jgi:beta-glucosidase
MGSLRYLITILFLGSLPCLGAEKSSETPGVESRSKQLLLVEGLQFRDLNSDQQLTPYEDWRLPTSDRVQDLVSRMTLSEKAGMLLIDTLNADPGGAVSDRAVRFIQQESMTRFIFRNPIVEHPNADADSIRPRFGAEITPHQAATFTNAIQQMAEESRLGIPVVFKSNARNHIDPNARAGINVSAGAFSAWPKEAGLAATRDLNLISEFGQTMRSEWTAVGIRSMYGYMMDLATEPRWYRVHETFTEDAELLSDIMRSLITNLQGPSLNSESVALTIKHFPGGGPQEGGGDPHYSFGKNQAYPTGNFDYHLMPFKVAIDAGVSSIMPYYGIPVGQAYQPNNVGMAFSKGIVTDLLRNELGFKGYVNSDTGIIGERAWGLEDKTISEQIGIAMEAGTDVLSGFSSKQQILDLVENGILSEERIDVSVRRLLVEQFDLGLFEDPYVDPELAMQTVGNDLYQSRAEIAQRKSIVLLKNENSILPLANPSTSQPLKIVLLGMDPSFSLEKRWGFQTVNLDQQLQGDVKSIPDDVDYAIIRVRVTNEGTGEELRFGGAIPSELDIIDFSGMSKAESWTISPSLDVIQSVMRKVGEDRTILSIYFRQPFVLDEESKLRDAGAIIATFGVADDAIMDIIAGVSQPQGKLPFALANSIEGVHEQAPDAPGYPGQFTLYPFGYGLNY